MRALAVGGEYISVFGGWLASENCVDEGMGGVSGAEG